ncbi:MAG: pyridoxal-phosphate dependent enzyme, partial [Steroidobacteraceae bacterium]
MSSVKKPSTSDHLTPAAIREAHDRIKDKIIRTPLMTSSSIDEMTGAIVYFKCENLQKIGAFKARGAANAVFSLTDEEAARGVATHSSGNHAAALARAAKLRGVKAHIVMPNNVPKAKQASVQRLGAAIVFCEPTLAAREAAAAKLVEETGATFVHPYDDLRVMAGQGTTGIELLQQAPWLDAILCPIGGGGLISGTAVAAKSIKPSIKVIGVEPAGADDAYRSFKAGKRIPMEKPNTIADGLRGSLSEVTFAHICEYVDDVVTVSDDAIVKSMRATWEIMKIIVEPSGA